MKRLRRLMFVCQTTVLIACFSALATSAVAQGRREELQHHIWTLKRLGDVVIRPTEQAAITLQFGDTSYTFSGICNRGVGKYWTRGISRIGFEPAVGSWHACPGINLDAKVGEMLSRANRYRVHNNGGVRSISLRRGWWVLAVLEAR